MIPTLTLTAPRRRSSPLHLPHISPASPLHLPQAPVFVDFRGAAIAEHVANRAWEAAKWVQALKKAKSSPREIFWKVNPSP